MREITIISGKGGTGKTSITAAFASLAGHAVFCDNDVDAANLHLLFDPEIRETHIFEGAWQAQINRERCTNCGFCNDHCRFEAIHALEDGRYVIDPIKCEGCRLCERVCQEEAISSERSRNNYWYASDSRFGTLIHAHMGPGEENSGKLVTLLRNKARSTAREQEAPWVINDGPPGIGCAAISSVTGTHAVVIVTEPTRSGFHDLKRVTELVSSFKVPAFAIINKHDLSLSLTGEIEKYLATQSIPVLAKVPFSEHFVEAMVTGKPVNEAFPGDNVSHILLQAWEKLTSHF